MASNTEDLPAFDLNEYDAVGLNWDTNDETAENHQFPSDGNAPEQTQMEDMGVQDLGVDDIVNQSTIGRIRPKLDAEKLLNARRGYPALLKGLRKVKYRGPGDEKKYLRKYVMTYQIWANRLWPKANFDDFMLLVRKAGRDPQVRQYCRGLIESEKYGSMDFQLPADANIDGSHSKRRASEDFDDDDGEISTDIFNNRETSNNQDGSEPNQEERSSTQNIPDEELADILDETPAVINEETTHQNGEPDDDELEALYGEMGF